MAADHHTLIGVDTGGTFTDLVWVSGTRILTAKTPSTPDDFSRGVLTGIRILQQEHPCSGFTLVHSSTVATNTLLEGTGAKIGLITTKGFRDVLEIGRQNRPHLYDLTVSRPPPLIPRARRLELDERITADGHVLQAPTEEEIERLLDRLERAGVQSVAVSLLFSFLQPRHERRISRAARRRKLPVSVSSEIVPEFREYERTSTTAVNAYVSPVMTRYLQQLNTQSRSLGAARLRIVQSNGGSLSARAAGDQAVHTLLSGPAAGLMGAVAMMKQARGAKNLITFDMGGTSTDVSLVSDRPTITTESTIAGHPVTVPMMDIHTVGAGGGSMAGIDAGGALQVGPESAGARPGPACYGYSTLATVTDANVVLGRISPEHFLGGRMAIDPQRARRAIGRLGKKMACSTEQAARSVIRIVNANMERAIRVISVERGFDCRDFSLVCFGGAGGLHACELAEALRIPRVVIPRHPGVLSAWGAVASDITKDYSQTVLQRKGGDTRVEKVLSALTRRARKALLAEGMAEKDLHLESSVDLRYVGQSFELSVPYAGDLVLSAKRFHQLHQQRYGHSDSSLPIELVTVRLRAIGRLAKPRLRKRTSTAARVPEAGLPLYLRNELPPGSCVTGPTLIVEDFSSTYLPPGWTARVDPYGHLELHP